MESGALRSLINRLCRAVLALLLAVQAANSLINSPLMNSYAANDAIVDYTIFHSAAEVREAAEKNIALANKAAMNSLAGEPAVDNNMTLQSTSDEQEASEKIRALGIAAEMAPSSEIERRTETQQMKVLGIAADMVAPQVFERTLVALDSHALDDIRGGFEPAGSTLSFSFGIERAVYINGELIAQTVLNVKDLQGTAGAGVTAASQVITAGSATGALGVVQRGAGNGIAVPVGSNVAGTVIQNTLDNQKIQNVTTVNAVVNNSAQVLRGMSVQSAVQSGIVSSLRR